MNASFLRRLMLNIRCGFAWLDSGDLRALLLGRCVAALHATTRSSSLGFPEVLAVAAEHLRQRAIATANRLASASTDSVAASGARGDQVVVTWSGTAFCDGRVAAWPTCNRRRMTASGSQ
ncbi:hypothetical protein [Nocardia abscessus]|uniref:hypothetical protein n=1 Tax=Nocardia abscessus TaxID=120957 RepID=UPI00245809B6|nr:hypothetical protein [Nocardia abscessus]